jgi:hypothetical protein
MFPARLDSSVAYDIAKAMMDGFNRHYQLFRTESARAKHRFETADWHGQQRAQRERIEFYDLRVKECSNRLEREFKAGEQPMDIWQQIKLHYIGSAGQPPPARTGRDFLQLGHHQDPAPQLLSRTTSSLCARRSAPSTLKTTRPTHARPTVPTTPRVRHARCADHDGAGL